jgi:hypothetical protein
MWGSPFLAAAALLRSAPRVRYIKVELTRYGNCTHSIYPCSSASTLCCLLCQREPQNLLLAADELRSTRIKTRRRAVRMRPAGDNRDHQTGPPRIYTRPEVPYARIQGLSSGFSLSCRARGPASGARVVGVIQSIQAVVLIRAFSRDVAPRNAAARAGSR